MIPNHMLFLYILVYSWRTLIPKISVFWLGISVFPTFPGWAVCPVKLSFLFKIKSNEIYTLCCPFGLTQYVPTDSCLDPVPTIPILSEHCCCSWCCQAACCHLLLTLIFLCIYIILRHVMNSKYALAECSLILSFFSNYDRSCVCSNNTVYAAARTFTDVILEDTDLSVLLVPLDSTNFLTVFFTHWPTVLKRKDQFFWCYKK